MRIMLKYLCRWKHWKMAINYKVILIDLWNAVLEMTFLLNVDKCYSIAYARRRMPLLTNNSVMYATLSKRGLILMKKLYSEDRWIPWLLKLKEWRISLWETPRIFIMRILLKLCLVRWGDFGPWNLVVLIWFSNFEEHTIKIEKSRFSYHRTFRIEKPKKLNNLSSPFEGMGK